MSVLGRSKNILKKKTEKSSKIGSKEGQKPLEPDLAGERKAQFGICCENVDSCCHLWNLLFCVGLYCYLQRFGVGRFAAADAAAYQLNHACLLVERLVR